MKNSTLSYRNVMLCLLLLAGSFRSFSQMVEKGITISNGERFGFLEYTPAEYQTEPQTKFPVIIFLHGIGERGNGTTELKNVARQGLPRLIKAGLKMRFTWNGKTESFIVLSPQCLPKYGMWPSNFVDELVQYAKKNYRIDTNRIYMTGLSMGGGGTYRYISDGKPEYPGNLAAVATICAPCTFGNAKNLVSDHLPVWSFHAMDDPTALVKCTQNAMAGINAWHPAVKPLVNYWPTGGHVVWDRVYTDTNYKYQGVVNIYEWFLAQNKSFGVNKLPVANAGGDRTLNGGTIVLDASRSTDEDGRLLRYVWKKLSGPASGTITTWMGPNASTTVTGITIPGDYTYELAAVDDRAAFTRDTVTIHVASVTAPAPVPVDTIKPKPPVKDTVIIKPPVKDTVITKPPVKDTVVSTKPVPDSVVTTPPPVKDTVITKPPVKDTVITKPPVKDTVITKPPVTSRPNKGPVASAGQEILTNTGYNQCQLNASLSTDGDGWIVKVRWTKLSGPSRYLIPDSAGLITNVKNLDTGIYVFRVYVTDNKGAVAYADKKVTVKAPAPPKVIPPNILPVAMAGDDAMTSIGWNRHILNSSLSKDKDGWITRVRWSKVAGPSKYKLLDTTALVTFATELEEGAYTFRVTVTDNRGGVATDDINITVVKRLSVTTTSLPLAVTADMKSPTLTPITAKEGIIDINPNPAINNLQLQYSSSVNGQTSIVVYDLNGRAIKNIMVLKTTTVLRQSVNINDLTNGIYYAVAKTGAKSYAPVKFIKQ